MQEYLKLILGDLTISYYAAAETFSILALIISLWLHSKTRDVASKNTPAAFSWKFLFWDNLIRIVVGQIAVFIIFRFFAEFMGRQLNMFWAVGVGFMLSFGLDKFIAKMKDKFSILQMPRDTDSSPKNS